MRDTPLFDDHDEPILVFGGSGSRRLTKHICQELGISPGRNNVLHFSEGTLFVRVQENVRGRRVYLVQSTAFPANDTFMELLFWIDAFKRASAERVTVVMPYFAYAKGDKKDEPRVAIRARVCADAIEAAGADRVVTLDLHSPQIQGFFKIPVDDLYAIGPLCNAIRALELENMVVVSPDAGFAKKARLYSNRLGAPLAIGDKERKDHSESAETLDIIGHVRGHTALLVDDVILSGGTLVNIAHKLLEEGARDVYAAVTHAAVSELTLERLADSPIRKLLVTDSIETQPVTLPDLVEVVTVAPLFAEAIRRIHHRESVSVLFDA
jgi:ribose-phosphate pyrophosphokinase